MARITSCVRLMRLNVGGVLMSVAALASAGLPADTATRGRADAIVLAAANSTDYDQGYRDGYGNQAYPDKNRGNKAYADGFKAGQERRRVGAVAPAGNADYQSGYRDGYDRQPYRDKNRRNKSYADGFKAGQTDRERGVAAAPQRPVAAGVSGRPRSLVGRSADDLETDMKAIGYTWRAGTMKGRESHTTWRGSSDSQCVLAIARNGKVASVTDVAGSNCR
jgi:hypothetical protein